MFKQNTISYSEIPLSLPLGLSCRRFFQCLRCKSLMAAAILQPASTANIFSLKLSGLRQRWELHLKHHVKHHGEAGPAWVLSCCVHWGQIKQSCACLLADRMDQHLLPHTSRPCQQDGFYQRSLLMYHLRTCRRYTQHPLATNTIISCVCFKCVHVSYLVVKLHTGIQPASRLTMKAWAQCRFVWVWSRGSCNHLGTEQTCLDNKTPAGGSSWF